MTMADIGYTLWPPATNSATPLSNSSSMLIDAADEVACYVFRIRKTGTVTRVQFLTGNVTTGATVDVRLETLNSSKQPSGTLFGTNTNVSHVIGNSDDNIQLRTATLTGSASVTAGDEIAVVIVNPSSSFGTINLASSGTAFTPPGGFPKCFNPARNSIAGSDQMHPWIALEYDDGTFDFPLGSFPANLVTTITLTTASNPDEVALYFTPPVKMRVVGWHALMNLAAAGDFRVNLYASGNDTPLMTKDYDGDESTASTSRQITELFGDSEVLAAGTTYRLGFLPTTANSVILRYWECHSSYLNLLDTTLGKQAMHYSARNRSGTTDPDAAAWSQTTNRRLFAGLIIDQFDDGAGGGGGLGNRIISASGGLIMAGHA